MVFLYREELSSSSFQIYLRVWIGELTEPLGLLNQLLKIFFDGILLEMIPTSFYPTYPTGYVFYCQNLKEALSLSNKYLGFVRK